MAALRTGSKCSHTNVYAPLFRRTAPCHDLLIHIFEMGSIEMIRPIQFPPMFLFAFATVPPQANIC